MAGGWSRDGEEHEQMDATVNDAVDRARSAIPKGESSEYCDECGNPIPAAPSFTGCTALCQLPKRT